MKKIFIDIETGGLDHLLYDPLEIGIIVEDQKGMVSEFSRFIKPWTHKLSQSAPKALEVNGITNRHMDPKLSKVESRVEIIDSILEFFKQSEITAGNSVFVAQNAPFDKAFFHKLMGLQKSLPYHWVDCVSLSYLLLEENRTGSLVLSKDKVAAVLGLPEEETPHRALNGARHLRLIFNKLEDTYEKKVKTRLPAS